MHHRVDAVVPVVDPRDRLVRLTEIGQVEPGRHHIASRRRRLIERDHIPAVVHQVIDNGPAELAAASCHRYPCHVLHRCRLGLAA
jgi:hypothetical protein